MYVNTHTAVFKFYKVNTNADEMRELFSSDNNTAPFMQKTLPWFFEIMHTRCN